MDTSKVDSLIAQLAEPMKTASDEQLMAEIGGMYSNEDLERAVKGNEAIVAAAVGVPMEFKQSVEGDHVRVEMVTAVPVGVRVMDGKICVYQGRSEE